MAEEQPAQGEQQPQEQGKTPTPADVAKAVQKPQGKPDDGGKDDLAGLKSALAEERENAKSARAEFGAFRDAFAKALGIDEDKKLTPEQLTAQVAEQTGRADAAERQLAVFRALPANVDSDALMDSTAFQRAISDVPADKVAETVTAFVADHPRFLRTNPAAGGRDLNEAPAPTGDLDPIAAEILSKIGR